MNSLSLFLDVQKVIFWFLGDIAALVWKSLPKDLSRKGIQRSYEGSTL
jgi:hypothetical protein